MIYLFFFLPPRVWYNKATFLLNQIWAHIINLVCARIIELPIYLLIFVFTIKWHIDFLISLIKLLTLLKTVTDPEIKEPKARVYRTCSPERLKRAALRRFELASSKKTNKYSRLRRLKRLMSINPKIEKINLKNYKKIDYKKNYKKKIYRYINKFK